MPEPDKRGIILDWIVTAGVLLAPVVLVLTAWMYVASHTP